MSLPPSLPPDAQHVAFWQVGTSLIDAFQAFDVADPHRSIGEISAYERLRQRVAELAELLSYAVPEADRGQA